MKAALVLVFLSAVGQISAHPWSLTDTLSKGKESLNLDKIKETIVEKKTDMTNQLDSVKENMNLDKIKETINEKMPDMTNPLDSIKENISLDKIKETIDEQKTELTNQLDSIKELPSEISEAIKNKAEEAQEKAKEIIEEVKNMQEGAVDVAEKIQKDVAELVDVEKELNELAEKGSNALESGKDAIKDVLPKNSIWNFWSRVVNWFGSKIAPADGVKTSENENNATSTGFLTNFWRGSKKE